MARWVGWVRPRTVTWSPGFQWAASAGAASLVVAPVRAGGGDVLLDQGQESGQHEAEDGYARVDGPEEHRARLQTGCQQTLRRRLGRDGAWWGDYLGWGGGSESIERGGCPDAGRGLFIGARRLLVHGLEYCAAHQATGFGAPCHGLAVAERECWTADDGRSDRAARPGGECDAGGSGRGFGCCPRSRLRCQVVAGIPGGQFAPPGGAQSQRPRVGSGIEGRPKRPSPDGGWSRPLQRPRPLCTPYCGPDSRC